jgi:hypothetical protein
MNFSQLLENKKICLVCPVVILAGLFFLFAASPIWAAECGESRKEQLTSYFNPLVSFAEKTIKGFGFDVSLAAEPDPDFCGSDTVQCSGFAPTATVTWELAPYYYDPSAGNQPDHYVLSVSGVGDFQVYVSPLEYLSWYNPDGTFSYDIASGLANGTTYNWSVEAYYYVFTPDVYFYCLYHPGACWVMYSSANLGVTDQPYGSFTAPNCAPAPTASISADSTLIPYNTATVVHWSSTNATACSVSPAGWTGTSGNQSTGNLTSSTTYTLNCTGPGGSASASVTVTVNNLPLASNLNVAQPDYCQAGPAASFSWIFSDADGDTQSAYRVQADNNANFSSPEVDSGQVSSASHSYATPAGLLSYDQTYYWRVMVWDSQGSSSVWANGSAFTVPKHAYPTIDFTWAPVNPSRNEDVQFFDQSVVYGSTKSSWSWNFQDGSPASSAVQNPVVKFVSRGSKTVTLRLTDSDGFFCDQSKTLSVQYSLPSWKEIIPW